MNYAEKYSLDKQEYTELKIQAFHVGERILKILNKNGIVFVSDLLDENDQSLKKIPGIRSHAVNVIHHFLWTVKNKDIVINETDPLSKRYNLNPDNYREIKIRFDLLKTRTSNRLHLANILTVSDLLSQSTQQLKRIQGFGIDCVRDVESYVKNIADNVNAEVIDSEEKTKDLSSIKEFCEKNKEVIIEGNLNNLYLIDLSDEEEEYLDRLRGTYNLFGKDLFSELYCKDETIKYIRNILMCTVDDIKAINSNTKQFEESIKTIPKDIKNKNIAFFVLNDLIDLSYLKGSHFDYSESICSVDNFMLLNVQDQKRFLSQIEWLSKDCDELIQDFFNRLFRSGDGSLSRLRVIIGLRSQGKTLREIGEAAGVTHERIRQIERKASILFSEFERNNNTARLLTLKSGEEKVLYIEDIKELLSSNSDEYIYLLKTGKDLDYVFFKAYNLFSSDSTLIELLEEEIGNLPERFDSSSISSIKDEICGQYRINDRLFTTLFNKKYKLSGNVYHRDRVSVKSIIFHIMEKYYPTGMHIYDSDELAQFKGYAYEEYGDDIELPPNDRALGADIARVCILCGRGEYKLKQDTYITTSLENRIKEYIDNSNSPIILFGTILVVFEDELRAQGINNKYLLQGVLRELFGSEYSFRRDYITKDSSITSLYEDIISFIKKKERPVSKEEIKVNYPGITDIVISLATSDEAILNLFGEYLHVDNLNLSKRDISYLKARIDEQLAQSQIVHSKKLFELISADYPEVLSKSYIKIQFSLFSVLNYLFDDVYNFARPYISDKSVEVGHPLDKIKEMIGGSKTYNIKDIEDYFNETYFRSFPILEFINTLNEEYYLLNDQCIISVSEISLSPEQIEDIDTQIYNLIKGTHYIKSILPQLNLPDIQYGWSDWLLYSLINRWSSKLEVSTDNNQFRYSTPIVSKAGHMDKDNILNYSMITESNIDVLFEDIMGEELGGDQNEF